MFFVHLTSTIILGVTYGTILVLHVFGAGIDAGILAPVYALISAMALFLNHNSVPFSTDDRTWGQLNFATRGVGVAAGGMAGQQWLHQAVGDQIIPYNLIFIPWVVIVFLIFAGFIFVASR